MKIRFSPAMCRVEQKTIRVFCGTKTEPPRILEPAEPLPAEGDTVDVPEDYRSFFERDITEALTDLAGCSTGEES